MDKTKIGDYIKQKRIKKGLTQSELAQLINVSHQAVSRWENGDNLPDVEKIYELAMLFGVTMDEMIQSGKQENLPSESHSLGLYAAINNVFSVVALILFYVLLLTTGVYWIAFIVQYPIVLGISLLYLLPFGKQKQKTRKDFQYVRTALLFNLGSLLLSLISIFMIGMDFYLPQVLAILISPAVILYVADATLRCYEINQFTSQQTTFAKQLSRNPVIAWIIKQIFLLAVAFALLSLVFVISTRLGDRPFYETFIILWLSIIWFSALTGLSLFLTFKTMSLKRSPLTLFQFITYAIIVLFGIYHVSLAGASVSENTFALLMRISTITAYISVFLMALNLAYAIKLYIQKKAVDWSLALQLFALALLTYLITSVGLEHIKWGTLVEINFTFFGSDIYPLLYVYVVLTLVLPKIKDRWQKKHPHNHHQTSVKP